MRAKWQYFILAVLLGIFSWYQVSGKERIEIWVQIPVEFSRVPEGLEVRQGMINKLDVRIRGPKGPVRGLELKNLAYTVDLRNVRQGLNTIVFDPRNVPIRRSIEVMEVNPPRMDLVVDSMATKTVPVKVRLSGPIGPDIVMLEKSVTPGAVTIHGPESIVQSISTVETKDVNIAEAKPGVLEQEEYLNLPEGVSSDPAAVSVSIRFGQRMDETWLVLPVRSRDAEANVRVVPSEVRVRVSGPAPLLRSKEFGKDLVALLDTVGTIGAKGRGVEYTVPLPEGVRLIEALPRTVRVTWIPFKGGRAHKK